MANSGASAGTMPIHPVTGQVIDTSVSEIIDLGNLPINVGFADLTELAQQLDIEILDLNAIPNDEWQAFFGDIRKVSIPDIVSPGICAQVRLQIVQEAVQTRQGFEATLELSNGLQQSLQGIGIKIVVTDADGFDVTDAFSIQTPELSLISDVSGFGTISAETTGSAKWTIIPTTEAAMDGPTEYFVGGTLTYNEAGTEVNVPLAPASITVVPQAELDLDYFLQRDVISDDLFTAELELAEPFTLAVRVKNNGAGAAKNLRIESAQPKIIENEKGLLIDFEITGTKINGGDVERSLTANFGNVDPGTIAEWQMANGINIARLVRRVQCDL